MFVEILFYLSSFLVIMGGLGVLFVRDIMHSCVALLGTLLGVAGLYVTLSADLLAVTQIMVYVGGVVILMLFAVMLTGGKDFKSKAQEIFGLPDLMGDKKTYFFGFLSAFVFLAAASQLIYKVTFPEKIMKDGTTVEAIGNLLITDHILAFEISSVLLLGALIGAAIIARPKKYAEIETEEEHH